MMLVRELRFRHFDGGGIHVRKHKVSWRKVNFLNFARPTKNTWEHIGGGCIRVPLPLLIQLDLVLQLLTSFA